MDFFFIFIFISLDGLVYYILLNSIDQQGTPTDAGIEPEKSLPFGAVVHGGHVT